MHGVIICRTVLVFTLFWVTDKFLFIPDDIVEVHTSQMTNILPRLLPRAGIFNCYAPTKVQQLYIGLEGPFYRSGRLVCCRRAFALDRK